MRDSEHLYKYQSVRGQVSVWSVQEYLGGQPLLLCLLSLLALGGRSIHRPMLQREAL